MPVTTVDIPNNLLNFIDELVRAGSARNRREIIVRALEIYEKFEVQKWTGSYIYINNIRKAIVSKGSLTELTAAMSNDELYQVGRRMGKTLKDSAIQRQIDFSLPGNHKIALQMLEDLGWGAFSVDDEKTITATASIFPGELIHGYLETALSLSLQRVETTEDILLFKSRQNADRKLGPAT